MALVGKKKNELETTTQVGKLQMKLERWFYTKPSRVNFFTKIVGAKADVPIGQSGRFREIRWSVRKWSTNLNHSNYTYAANYASYANVL